MFQHRELGMVQAYQIGATLILAAVFWGYYFVLGRILPDFSAAGFQSYYEYFFVILFGFQVSFLSFRQRDILAVSTGIVESHRFIWSHMLFAAAITCMFAALMKDSGVAPLFLLTFIPMAYVVLLIFNRYFALDILRFILKQPTQKLVLIGNPPELANVESLLSKAKLFGFATAGMITEARQEDLPAGLRRLGGPEDLERVLDEHGIGNIFILGSPKERPILRHWMRLAEARGCRVSLVNDLDVFLQRKLSYFRCNDVDLIELRREPLQNLINRALKRAFDIVVSLPVVCLVLPPLMLVVWIFQRFQSPGPLFFHQSRSGLDNRRFNIIKFRTMRAGNFDATQQASRGDPRVYPAARFLRRFSLDEFPQFFNVLRGDMSIGGPRPHMTRHDEIFEKLMVNYRIRGFVKPGITGLAQIRGFRGETATTEDVVRRVESDIEYIENWSFMLDVRILWVTAWQLVRPPKSAY